MRYHILGAAALAATFLTAGVAMAADERSRSQADAEATYEYVPPVIYGHQPLGYAPVIRVEPNDPFGHMRVRTYEPPVQTYPDDLFLDQGDRGLGNN